MTAARARCVAALLLALLPLAAPAARPHFDAHRPPAAQPPGEAVAVSAARVQHFVLDGPNGHRYRIQVAALGTPPAAGYPVLYLLDGNAAMAALTAAHAAPPLRAGVLLVAVGYDTDAYFDTDARSLDYTPPLPDGRPAFDPRVPGRRGGGAEAFLDFLQQRLQPRIARAWPVDAHRQGIWGHSYGALLALHALYTRPGLFRFYAAASPALWWHAPLMADEASRFVANHRAIDACVLLMAGSGERGPKAAEPAPALARQLRAVPGLQVTWRSFPGLRHGQVFSASLGPAIRRFAAGCPAPRVPGGSHVAAVPVGVPGRTPIVRPAT